MAENKSTFDVFISHSADDAAFANEIANACRANGLDATTHADLLGIDDASDALWEAMAESRALLAVVSKPDLSPSMLFELGAARAWNKQVFGLVTNPTVTDLPHGISNIHLYSAGRIEDVIRAIQLSGKELSEDDRARLAELYSEVGVPVDQLALDPSDLGELVKRFSAETGRTMPGERLLSELLRLRKQGKLTRSRTKVRRKAHRGTA
ncbi:MAG TPA: toll/interleukin-1 receptor domain-containing protein [Gemmataceae bacterium]|nr:toll/interleukin-1 receptor domain-containing protein [Gemmataceae bacterium]